MNDEIRKAFADLSELMFLINYDFAPWLDEIKLEFETWGYIKTHKEKLDIIVSGLKIDAIFSEKLQRLIDLLGTHQ